jgi:nucleotide-binding universal stress UspA family protein
MTTHQDAAKTYPIVVGVDYSALGDLALERAFELAKAHDRTELHVVRVESVVPPSDYASRSEDFTADLSAASARLHDHVENVVKRWCDARASGAPFERLTTHVRSENAAEAIAQLASDVEAELVVVGTHGRRGARRFLLGSVAEGTVRLAPCSVLVVRPPDASIPAIEPPCPRCLETRRATSGAELWCEQHREQHDRRHTYHYTVAQGSRQSGFLIHAR